MATENSESIVVRIHGVAVTRPPKKCTFDKRDFDLLLADGIICRSYTDSDGFLVYQTRILQIYKHSKGTGYGQHLKPKRHDRKRIPFARWMVGVKYIYASQDLHLNGDALDWRVENLRAVIDIEGRDAVREAVRREIAEGKQEEMDRVKARKKLKREAKKKRERAKAQRAMARKSKKREKSANKNGTREDQKIMETIYRSCVDLSAKMCELEKRMQGLEALWS